MDVWCSMTPCCAAYFKHGLRCPGLIDIPGLFAWFCMSSGTPSNTLSHCSSMMGMLAFQASVSHFVTQVKAEFELPDMNPKPKIC